MLQTHALLGLGLTLVTIVIFIFLEIGNTSVDQPLPKKIRLAHISTTGLGTAFANTLPGPVRVSFTNASLYGNPIHPHQSRTPGDGLRTYYTWGLWNVCAGYHSPSELQYCAPIQVAQSFTPTAAILEDVPPLYSAGMAALLTNEKYGLKDDKSLRGTSKMAGFALLSAAGHLIMMIPISIFLMIGKGPAMLPMAALGIQIPTVMSCFISAALWTSMISGLQGKLAQKMDGVDLGITVEFGAALWILWVIAVFTIISSVPFVAIFIAARRAEAERKEVEKLTQTALCLPRKDSY
ncbi:hypothetical protein CROQUDRAFT_57136 [Cronartium quercuum f. sp. fusiforme G11]|uniref:Uncharacterized protein n=1 Tax=Cronartium quercuum f. sp. fusiforme G11 TaxID=708437 RepID=A0A9P6TFY2_9BASI|nr:hypothetical protein CROQUDRAFT_57136 [Cronartium quercuum f. sp. fusiforme G11]